jgi:hypothetical protein
MATERGSGITNPTAFLAIALWTGAISAQPSPIGGASLFAPLWQAGRIADTERALPMIALYKTPKSGNLLSQALLLDLKLQATLPCRPESPQLGFCITLEALTRLTGWHRGSCRFHMAGHLKMGGLCQLGPTGQAVGTAGRRAYLDIWSNATDVVNSVAPAHAAVFHV